jgi:hypothetical protein
VYGTGGHSKNRQRLDPYALPTSLAELQSRMIIIRIRARLSIHPYRLRH